MRLMIPLALLSLAAASIATAEEVWQGKPVPAFQATPQPYDQVAFQRRGEEIARYHFGPTLHRPFVFPLIGPAGRSLTRMGHPHDPVGHSHHNSVWISHHNLEGIDFWGDRGAGRIVHRRVLRLEDGPTRAAVVTENEWTDVENARVVLREERTTALWQLADDQWLLEIQLRWSAPGEEPVTIGETPFGPIGVRMAKSIGVHDGGGRLRNSEGLEGEEAMFRLPARWVDYSGSIAEGVVEGLTLMDHPENPGHPSPFHVRNDGWMGVCLTLHGARVIEPGTPLQLRYGVLVHAGMPEDATLEAAWKRFAELPLRSPEEGP